MKQIILVFFFKKCTTMHFFAFFSHIYIIIISTIFSVPAQWSQWSKHTWFWSSRVRTPPGARLDKLQILEKFQIQTNFRFRQILDKKIGYHLDLIMIHYNLSKQKQLELKVVWTHYSPTSDHIYLLLFYLYLHQTMKNYFRKSTSLFTVQHYV